MAEHILGWRPGETAPDEPPLEALERLAALPLRERWPWLGDLERWGRHPRPEVRAAVLRCTAGCDGLVAEELLVAGLHDGHHGVRSAALAALAALTATHFHLWIHPLCHPDPEIRRAAVGPMATRAPLMRLRALADPETRDTVVAALSDAPMDVALLGVALDHVALGHLPAPALARWMASLPWERLDPIVGALSPTRTTGPPAVASVAAVSDAVDRARAAPDRLDTVLEILRSDPAISDTIARRLLEEATPHGAAEPRLGLAVLVAAERDPDLPVPWIGWVARRWPAVLGWRTLTAARRRRAADWLRPDPQRLPARIDVAELDLPNLLAPPLDVELALTLLRIGTPAALSVMAPWIDAPTFAALARARPEAASQLLSCSDAAHPANVPVRAAWLRALVETGALHGELLATLLLSGGPLVGEAASALPPLQDRSWLPLFDRHAVGATAARIEAAVEAVAARWPEPGPGRIGQLLELERPGPFTLALLARQVTSSTPEVLARGLTRAQLARMAELDGLHPVAPWPHLLALGALLPREVARRLGWLPPEPGHPLARGLPEPGPPRALGWEEVREVRKARGQALERVVAPYTTTSVTGLAEALVVEGARSELACVACLASNDPLDAVAAALTRLGLPEVVDAVERRMVALWSGRSDPSPATALWLYRWEPHLERFVAWAEGRGGLAVVLVESLGWASPALRLRAWEAALTWVRVRRWRTPRAPLPVEALDRAALAARGQAAHRGLGSSVTDLRVALGRETPTHAPRPARSIAPSPAVAAAAPETPATPSPSAPPPAGPAPTEALPAPAPPPPPVLAAAAMLLASDAAAAGWLVGLSVREAAALARSAMIVGPSVIPPARLLAPLKRGPIDPYVEEIVAETVLRGARTADVQEAALPHLFDLAQRARAARRLAELVIWGRQQSRRLLGSTFRVEVIGGDALGWTRLRERSIHVNPVAFLRGERDGEDVARGLVVHELGHHLYNADAQGLEVWKRANDAGLARLHNLVCDEHLERNLRVFDPAYGDHLKRLAAWAFHHAQREIPVTRLMAGLGANLVPVLLGARLEPARRAWQVRVSMGRLLRGMDAGTSFGRFVRALRMGLGDREGDPRVAEALRLFGPEFRHLDNEGLYRVTLALRDLFADHHLSDLVDLHEVASDDPGEGRIAGGGVTSDQVTREADGGAERGGRESDGTSGRRRKGGSTDRPNTGADTDFQRIQRVEVLQPDPAAHRALAADVAVPARHLRRILEQLGLRSVPVRPRLAGVRIDRSRLVAMATRNEPRVMIQRRRESSSDLFVGLVVDCSGSMSGARMERARRFAVLVAEACRHLPGVDLRVFGFTDKIIWDAGDADRSAAHALAANGGNNDAAGLHHAAQAALASRRRSRLLVMVSDGAPTECTTTALRGLVRHLERRKAIACAQVVVAHLTERCFDTYLEVLDDDMAKATRAFGAIIARLVRRTLSTSR